MFTPSGADQIVIGTESRQVALHAGNRRQIVKGRSGYLNTSVTTDHRHRFLAPMVVVVTYLL